MKGLIVLEWMPVVLVFNAIRLSDEACYHPGRPAGSHVQIMSRIRNNGTYSTGTVATYYCHRGYLKDNTSHLRTCLSNGSWSNSNTSMNCEMNPCKRWLGVHRPSITARINDICFGLISHWIPKSTEAAVATQCRRFTHELTYSVIGDFHRFLENQTDMLDAFCKRSHNQDIVIMMDQISPFMTEKGRLAYVYKCINPQRWRIVNWDVAIYWYHFWICIYNATCTYPSQNENSELHMHASRAQYGCPEGFLLQGSQFRYCMEHGQWTNNAPTCQYIECTVSLPDGNVSLTLLNGSRSNGSWVEQKCPPGLVMVSGSRFIQCIHGHWEGEAALCQLELVTSEAQVIPWCSLSIGIGIIVGITIAVITVTWLIAGMLVLRKRRKQ